MARRRTPRAERCRDSPSGQPTKRRPKPLGGGQKDRGRTRNCSQGESHRHWPVRTPRPKNQVSPQCCRQELKFLAPQGLCLDKPPNQDTKVSLKRFTAKSRNTESQPPGPEGDWGRTRNCSQGEAHRHWPVRTPRPKNQVSPQCCRQELKFLAPQGLCLDKPPNQDTKVSLKRFTAKSRNTESQPPGPEGDWGRTRNCSQGKSHRHWPVRMARPQNQVSPQCKSARTYIVPGPAGSLSRQGTQPGHHRSD